jgi:DNA/RNA endonuclease G (NUC1)
VLTILAVTLLYQTGFQLASAASADAEKQAGIVECTPALLKKINPGLAGKPDSLVCFEAYVSNFDTGKKTADNGRSEPPGIPHWVIQHIERAVQTPETRKRPRAWFTIPHLQEQGLAPTDASYKFSKPFRDRHPNWFERGHLAQKYLAERVGETAGWFTHNVANAVPQRSQFNKGPWLTLECFTGAWSNQYGEVWVLTGPVFTRGKPAQWLRSDSDRKALPVAVSDSLFKIVFKKGPKGDWEMLAFIYPQEDRSYRKGPWNPAVWLTSVSQIERLTRQEFLVSLANGESGKKDQVAAGLWSTRKQSFDPGCKRFAKEIP